MTPLTATLQPLNGATNRPSLAKTSRPTAISWELQQSHPTWLPTTIPLSSNSVADTEALFLQNEEQAQSMTKNNGGEPAVTGVPIIPGVTPVMESGRPPLPGTVLPTGGNVGPSAQGQGLANTQGQGLAGNNGITTSGTTDGVPFLPWVTSAPPSEAPSMIPPPRTFAPSQSDPPSHFPTEHPSVEPTFFPSQQPSVYTGPTRVPTLYPTRRPTREPTTALPSFSPTPIPSRIPTGVPSRFPISVAFTQAVGKEGPKSGPKAPVNSDADEENYLLTFLGTRIRRKLLSFSLRGSSASSSSSSSSSLKKS